MAGLKLSDDGLYYWDGQTWVSTLSPDGHFRWNGSAWAPVAGMGSPAYPQFQPAKIMRIPTPWTQPMQYAVAAYYAITGLYALSLPFTLAGTVSRIVNQVTQPQPAQNPYATPLPPEAITTVTNIAWGFVWISAVVGVVIAAVVIVGALQRWTWLFWVVLVFEGLGTLSLPGNIASALVKSGSLNPFQLPSWITWVSIVIGIPGAALFVWMLIAVIRYGPWATTKKVEWPGTAAQAPAS